MNWAHYIPYAAMALGVGLILWRGSRRTRVRPRAMLALPLIVAALIGMGLWFNPHPTLTAAGAALLAAAVAAGVGIGQWRAAQARLARDPDGSVWMTTSPAATIAILGLLLMRQLGRGAAGADGDPARMSNDALLAFDAFLLFAAAMVLVNRMMLWRRVRRLTAPR